VFYDLSLVTTILLFAAIFFAGFVDAVAGGGGLIQQPSLLITFSETNTVTVMGTSKTAAAFGTSAAALKYRRSIKTDPQLLLAMVIPAFVGSSLGALLATHISAQNLKSAIFMMMVLIFLYTLAKPELGKNHVDRFSQATLKKIGAAAALIIGFYDGLIGPGTGTLLMIVLVALMGFAFIGASAIAKVVNLVTNIAAIIVIGFRVPIMWKLGIALGLANLVGGFIGSHVAVKKGSGFVRTFYLIVTALLIVRLGYDIVTQL